MTTDAFEAMCAVLTQLIEGRAAELMLEPKAPQGPRKNALRPILGREAAMLAEHDEPISCLGKHWDVPQADECQRCAVRTLCLYRFTTEAIPRFARGNPDLQTLAERLDTSEEAVIIALGLLRDVLWEGGVPSHAKLLEAALSAVPCPAPPPPLPGSQPPPPEPSPAPAPPVWAPGKTLREPSVKAVAAAAAMPLPGEDAPSQRPKPKQRLTRPRDQAPLAMRHVQPNGQKRMTKKASETKEMESRRKYGPTKRDMKVPRGTETFMARWLQERSTCPFLNNLKPGMVIKRVYRGVERKITVKENHYEIEGLEGGSHPTLNSVMRHIVRATLAEQVPDRDPKIKPPTWTVMNFWKKSMMTTLREHGTV